MKHKLLLAFLLIFCVSAWAENGFLRTIPIIHPLYGQLYDYEPKGVYPLPDGSMSSVLRVGKMISMEFPGATDLLSHCSILMATWCGIVILCGDQSARFSLSISM